MKVTPTKHKLFVNLVTGKQLKIPTDLLTDLVVLYVTCIGILTSVAAYLSLS